MSTIGGVSSWQTRQPYTPPNFSQLDTNSDGGISLDEFEAGAPKAASGSDATPSAAQQKRAEALFSKIDSNGDGSISNDELSSFQSKIAEQRSSQQFATQLLASGQQPPSDADVFSATDKNGDGSVSLSEFSSSDAAKGLSSDQLSQLFNTVDTNGDGSISSTESSTFLDTLKSQTGQQASATGASGVGGAGHPHGGHHHAGGAGNSTQSSSGGGLLQAVQDILNGTSSDSTTASTDGSGTNSDDGSTSSSSPLDLLTAAVNAYTTGSSATTQWSSYTSLLQEAA